MPIYPSVNSATVDVLTKLRHGETVTDATLNSEIFGLLNDTQQRVVLRLIGLVQARRKTIDAWVTANLRNPRDPLPDAIHEIIALGLAQLDVGEVAPRLVVSSLVGQTTDQGFTQGMARLVNALLVSYSIQTNAEQKAQNHDRTEERRAPRSPPLPPIRQG